MKKGWKKERKGREPKEGLWRQRAFGVVKGIKSVSEMELLLCVMVFFVTGVLFFSFQTQAMEEKAALYALLESREYLYIITLFAAVAVIGVVMPWDCRGMGLLCLMVAFNVGIEVMVFRVPGMWGIWIHLMFCCAVIYFVSRALEGVLEPPEAEACQECEYFTDYKGSWVE